MDTFIRMSDEVQNGKAPPLQPIEFDDDLHQRTDKKESPQLPEASEVLTDAPASDVGEVAVESEDEGTSEGEGTAAREGNVPSEPSAEEAAVVSKRSRGAGTGRMHGESNILIASPLSIDNILTEKAPL